MQPEDLDKELSRLWAKVGSVSGGEPASLGSFGLESAAADLSLDTIALLKRQHRVQERNWAELMETRERALAAHKERQRALEEEVRRLRERLQDSESRVMAEAFDAQSRLEAGMRSLEEDKARAAEEQAGLQNLLEATRLRLAEETSRFKAQQNQWDKREQQYLIDIKELQALAARYQQEADKSEDGARRLGDNMKEAKNALEKTLAELLMERQVREETEKERAAALKKVDEVEKHFAELSKIWEEERSQWRELWDRERSTWETQRVEFSAWEERLRKEREAWHAELQSKEASQLQFVSQVNQTLRESAETSTKMASVLKILQGLGLARLSGEGAKQKVLTSNRFFAAAAFCIFLALVPSAWRYFKTPHFKLVSSAPMTLGNPTSLAFDGASVWVSEWDGPLLSFDPADASKIVKRAVVAAKPPYHPVALTFGRDFMWSLDSAQSRLLKHKGGSPEQVVASRAAPGPAPMALAYDGESVWSYDAVNKAFYRHDPSEEANVKTFIVEQELVPSSMIWARGQLWVADSKTRGMMVFELKGDRLKLLARQPFAETVLGMTLSKKQLWVLAGPSAARTGYALLRYKY